MFFSSYNNGAPESPSTQQAPLHAFKSHTKYFLKMSKEIILFSTLIISQKYVFENIIYIFVAWLIMKMFLRK